VQAEEKNKDCMDFAIDNVLFSSCFLYVPPSALLNYLTCIDH
jgi:hypothetical protein